MKIAFFVASILLYGNVAQAQTTCSEPQFGDVTESGKVYHFSVSTTCTTTREAFVIASLRDTFIEKLASTDGTKISQLRSNELVDGLTGSSFEMVEEGESGHGHMIVTSTNSVSDDGNSKFLFESRSTNVDADGDAHYTEAVQRFVTVTKEGNRVSVVIRKDADVRKPGIAPKKLFKSKAQEGLKSDLVNLQKTVLDYLSL